MSTQVPTLFAKLVDDAAVFPPGNAPLPHALAAHRGHRAAWYAPMVGPLLLPASALSEVPGPVAVGVVGDTGMDGLFQAVDTAADGVQVHQVEIAVAKRGEDPGPGLRALLALLAERPSLFGYAEIPLTWGLMAALDTLADVRRSGALIAPKFRTGGLAAELFPTPAELAAVVCACRDRDLPFKLTAGLHRATRYTDPETGFAHHGFLNVLVATAVAADGGTAAEVTELLGSTDPVPLIETARRRLGDERPLWVGFGTCSIGEPLDDLQRVGLLPALPAPALPAQIPGS